MARSQTQEEAADVLRRGGAAIFPTDTVYGVGVAVRFAEGPALLYDLKQRERGKPVAWLVGGAADLERYGRNVRPYAARLAQTFWPGPLTLVVQASEEVPRAFQSEAGTVGLRMPGGLAALALIRAVGSPLATTSANPSGAPSAHTFDELDEGFVHAVGCALRDEAVMSGLASTVLDCTGAHPKVLREGAVSAAHIEAHI